MSIYCLRKKIHGKHFYLSFVSSRHLAGDVCMFHSQIWRHEDNWPQRSYVNEMHFVRSDTNDYWRLGEGEGCKSNLPRPMGGKIKTELRRCVRFAADSYWNDTWWTTLSPRSVCISRSLWPLCEDVSTQRYVLNVIIVGSFVAKCMRSDLIWRNSIFTTRSFTPDEGKKSLSI